MKKSFKILAVICILQMTIMYGISYAAAKPASAMMQKHVDKVKRIKPATYQKMLEKAGGAIINCASCHQDFGKKSNAFSPNLRR